MDLSEALEGAILGGSFAPATLADYRSKLGTMRAFGIATTGDVTVPRLVDYSRRRLSVVRSASLRQDFVVLATALRFVRRVDKIEWRRCRKAVRAVRPKLEAKRVFRAPFLDRASYEALVAGAVEPVDALLVQVATLSGLRCGEVCRLRWEDVDLAGGAVHVREGKTGERRSPVCAELRGILERSRGTGRVVAAPRSEVMATGAARARLRRASAASGVRATFHLLRHTRAAWWLQANVSLAKVSLWLGHSPETCARYYGSLLQGYDPDCERVPAAWHPAPLAV